MSYDEKNAWVYALVAIGGYAGYLVVILGRAQGVPLTSVAYVMPMILAISAATAASIVGHIVIAAARPKEAGRTDQRDKEIHRHGEYVGGMVLAVSVIVPLGLAMAEIDYFWIANAIYLAFVLSALCGTAVKLVTYRRGF
ncbi:hypothetical protein G3I60_32550 [Streptomyces sp. SID13666]|uniref:hypothetical protein n=1 Tax=unclassified Streptomyces TaxID=2593676 RepID=UPI0013BFF299|nr:MULTISPECIES: hypothetical protein [unclassified Streptomyces]NEA58762.1 hypothetical protein [Streptomyces sp. SID13666]NEA70097.1 hypothetical protein [Streptomyces sp. SID13588]